jgi:UDP-N-acetyl-alpha-D-muramoyl-L-alanyl-L-glutamate epimerase
MKKDNHSKFENLRSEFPCFTYNNYHFEVIGNIIEMNFDFRIGNSIRFNPKMKLKLNNYNTGNIKEEEMEGLVFHIGLIELISYWKSTCSQNILLKNFSLNAEQQSWWKKLYWKGLGEFFYQNSINISKNSFINFFFDENAKPAGELFYKHIEDSDKVIVPVGGGKDSVVTLESLKKEKEIIPFIINPRGATLDCARIAGFENIDNIVILEREIDKKLLELNDLGFLNGHTPFSAMLAFYTLLVSYGTNVREIALSNESSANEPTIPGTDINHQYSKSIEFEEDFRQYVNDNMNGCAHYYSYLRPFSELEIAKKFAGYPAYFNVFKSCNAGSKENSWCCRCSKCLFAYIILSPFIEDEKMISIFGEDLLDKKEMVQYFDELTGIAENKPFECVGTVEEVNRAIAMIHQSRKDKYLIKHYYKNKK